MNKLIGFLMISLLLVFSCDKDETEDANLVGRWELIEVLADPGDGSGTFQNVSSDKYLEFNADSTITSNGQICDMTLTSSQSSSGTYSLLDSTLTSSACNDSTMKIKFSVQGSNLIVYYPCIEACQAKFEKK